MMVFSTEQCLFLGRVIVDSGAFAGNIAPIPGAHSLKGLLLTQTFFRMVKFPG